MILNVGSKSGSAKSIDEYRDEFAGVFATTSLLERLAFEEYRLLASTGQLVQPDRYRKRYGVRTDHWPVKDGGFTGDHLSGQAVADGIADEMHRIVSVTRPLPSLGDDFLGFEIVELLSECRFGCVYLARQHELADRRVVIKITTNLWSESDRLARLQHTNIVPVHSVHQSAGLQAVCMPYLGRRTLADFIAEVKDASEQIIDDEGQSSSRRMGFLRRRPAWTNGWVRSNPNRSPSARGSYRDCDALLSAWLACGDLDPRVDSNEDFTARKATRPERHLNHLRQLSYEHLCVWIVANISAGLSQAHDRGICHRDLKPANILLTDDFQPLILDFNLSEDAMSGGKRGLLVGGTLPYMAPEHVKAVVVDGAVDERSDLYSLGVILFQLLTGELPFVTLDGSVIGNLSFLMEVRSKPAPRVQSLSPHVSSDAARRSLNAAWLLTPRLAIRLPVNSKKIWRDI